MTKPSPELQQYWNQQLKDSGFKDIESPSGKSVSRLPAVSLTEAHCADSDVSLYDTPNAEYWRLVGRAAAELSPDDNLYCLVNEFADSGSFTQAAMATGIRFNVAAPRIRNWLASLGLTSTPGGKRIRKAQREE